MDDVKITQSDRVIVSGDQNAINDIYIKCNNRLCQKYS